MTPAELSRAVLCTVRRAVAADELRAPVPERVVVERPRGPRQGDYATGVALRLARPAGRPPLQVAEILAARLADWPGVARVEIAGPGFLNITVAADAHAGLVRTIRSQGPAYGHGDALAGTAVTLVHGGETRAAVVAEAAARLLRACGARAECAAREPVGVRGVAPAWEQLERRPGVDAVREPVRARDVALTREEEVAPAREEPERRPGVDAAPEPVRVRDVALTREEDVAPPREEPERRPGADAAPEPVRVHNVAPPREEPERRPGVDAAPEPVRVRSVALTWDELEHRLGADAARWALLRPPAQDAPCLDPAVLLLQRESNPLFRVRYAHARTRALLRNARDLGFTPEEETAEGAYRDPAETGLLAVLADHPRIVEAAARHRGPDRLARHLERVADAFLRMQDTCPVLPRGDEKPSAAHRARLALADAAGTVLAGGLTLLGISAPERL